MPSRKRSKPEAGLGEHDHLGLEKLATSGLSLEDGEALGMTFHASAQLLHKSFKPLPCLRLPYWHPLRPAEPLTAHPRWPGFYRIRYLKQGTDFESLAEKKPIRYTQEPGSSVAAYYPRLPDVDWADLLADAYKPLIITEGELKAAKACREGFPTIGLGGVHNFRASSEGTMFLPELALANWVKRYVYIIYDSDFRTNPNICRALNELAEELAAQGALPHMVPLPEVSRELQKTGLDDFLVYESRQALEGLLRDTAEPLTLAQPLLRLNEQVTYVRDPGLVIDVRTGQKLSTTGFKEGFANRRYAERVVKDNGHVSMKPASVTEAWLRWPLRSEVDCLTYAPGKGPDVTLAGKGQRRAYNTWTGWAVEPRKGDPGPFLQLLDHLFTGAEPEAKQWLLRWLAYPLQYPGVKMFSAAAIHGKVHGTGKSLIGYTVGRIYGKNFVEIDDEKLHNNFNEWAENKQFVLGDDVTGSDKRSDNDMLKRLITQREIRLNLKFVPSFTIPDCINYLFTSNQPDAFFLEDDDRRFFVHEVTVDVLPEVFYVDYDLWLDTGGSSIVFDYLLNLDLGDFNPAAKALRTYAKDRMTADTRSDLGTWVRKLLTDPDSVLRLGEAVIKHDLFTNKELLRIYDPGEKTRLTANGMGRELTRAGVRQVLDGRTVKTPKGFDRVYAIRNASRWLRADREAVQAYLAKHALTQRY